jgi:hypothetical protein
MSGAAAGAAAAAAIAQAIKASGVLVRVEPDAFQRILVRIDSPLVVHATGGFLRTSYKYMVSYKGFAFFTKSARPIELSGSAEVIVADRIWIPG